MKGGKRATIHAHVVLFRSSGQQTSFVFSAIVRKMTTPFEENKHRYSIAVGFRALVDAKHCQ
jgi:hypothetical protein